MKYLAPGITFVTYRYTYILRVQACIYLETSLTELQSEFFILKITTMPPNNRNF